MDPQRPGLHIGFVPGVQPDKWLRRWRERYPDVLITAHVADRPRPGDEFDVVFFREWDSAPRSAPEGLLRIPLYTEDMAVIAPKDHVISAFDALTPADLEGETLLDVVDPTEAGSEAVSGGADLVEAGVGLLALPLPWARALGRKGLVIRLLREVPATRMGVAWSADREGDAMIDDFVGIVRGRTANSSRGSSTPVGRDRSAPAAGSRRAKGPSGRGSGPPKKRGRGRR